MIINGQFFIFTYTGVESLDLMQIPDGINDDSTRREKYNRFIQSVDTIYGPQNLAGEMPKFWTRLTQASDDLGNIVYSYEPHPECTLTSLSSLTAYYIILRDSSLVPLEVPVKGGEVFGFTDISSLPSIDGISSCNANVTVCSVGTDDSGADDSDTGDSGTGDSGTGDSGTGDSGTGDSGTNGSSQSSTGISQIKLTENNSADVVFNLSNLRPFEVYSYSIESVAANWPVNISPVSGLIKPSKDTGKIDVNLLFCPATGVVCGDNIIDYAVNDGCLLRDNSVKFANIRLALNPVIRPDLQVYGDQHTVICEDCLPDNYQISITDSDGVAIDEKTIVEEDFDGFAYHEFDLSLTPTDKSPGGVFEKDTNFNYSIEILEAEWPIIFVSPTGGIITAKKGLDLTVQKNTRFFLCPTSGLCPQGSNNVPNYDVPKYPTFLAGEDILTSVYNVKVRAAVESYDCPGNKVYSNTSTISFIR